jgi:hypothetical protein
LRARGNEDGAAAPLEHGERPLRNIAADRIEDRIAVGHHLCEIAGVVVDGLIGAEAAHVGVVGRARGGDHAGADMLCQLDRKNGNPAGCAWMRIVSPRLSFNVSSIALKAVRPVKATAVASTCGGLAGFFATMAALMAIFSA